MKVEQLTQRMTDITQRLELERAARLSDADTSRRTLDQLQSRLDAEKQLADQLRTANASQVEKICQGLLRSSRVGNLAEDLSGRPLGLDTSLPSPIWSAPLRIIDWNLVKLPDYILGQGKATLNLTSTDLTVLQSHSRYTPTFILSLSQIYDRQSYHAKPTLQRRAFQKILFDVENFSQLNTASLHEVFSCLNYAAIFRDCEVIAGLGCIGGLWGAVLFMPQKRYCGWYHPQAVDDTQLRPVC